MNINPENPPMGASPNTNLASPQINTTPLSQAADTSTSTSDKILNPELLKNLHNDINSETVNKKLSDHPLAKFIAENLITYTTTISAVINFISAPLRMLEDNSPIKQLLNKISMALTKTHLATYSVSGLISAFEQKNPYTLFSFFTEGLAAFLGLREIYLFRGIATGVDGAVTGINDKYKKTHFKSFSEAALHYAQKAKEIYSEFIENPKSLFDFDKLQGCLVSSFFMVFGGLFGMTVNEKVGGLVRDISGAVNDYAIFKLDDPKAKKAGLFYWAGSILDISARIFSQSIGKLLGIEDLSLFTRFRDFLHETSIGFDRIGQYHLLRFLQKDEKEIVKASPANEIKRQMSKPLHAALAA